MAAMGVVGPLNLSALLRAQTAAPQTSETQSSWPPPRAAHQYNPESRELLGPVKMCIEESSHGGVTTREYGPDRKLLTIRMERDGKIIFSSLDNPASETRDAQDRMLSYRTQDGRGGIREVSYNYDETGTLRSITNDQNSDRTEFREVNGAKISIQTFDPESLAAFRNGIFGGPDWEGTLFGIGVPTGGSVITTYDEPGNPIELRILTADGQLVRQSVRKYDASGRLEEEKTLRQNNGLLFLDRMTPEQKAGLTPEKAQAIAKHFNEMHGKLPPE
jgi:hypothetical protein